LSLISTNVGGGIVGVPFAFLHLGVPLGIALTALAAFQTQISCKLYLQTRSMIPGKLESYYELGFMLYGRLSIYYISAVIAIQAFGLMMVYFIVFADISRSIVVQVFKLSASSVFSSRACYCAILGVGLFPQIIKKELKELKIASIILFVGISTFLAVLADELITEGESANHDKSFEAYWSLGYDVSAVKGASFILVAFGLQCSLFPLFNSLAI
jgi:amino acid permease